MANTGQTGPKRTATQRARDRAFIARHMALGFNVTQTAAMLRRQTEPDGYTISDVGVWRDHKANLRELAQQREDDTRVYRDRQLQQLTYVINEAAQAFEKSKEPRREQHAKRINNLLQVNDPDAEDGKRTTSIVGREEVSTGTVERIPSARHLEVIVKAAERMANLLGLDARPEEAGVGGTGTPAPIAKATMPFEQANGLLLAAMGRPTAGEHPALDSCTQSH